MATNKNMNSIPNTKKILAATASLFVGAVTVMSIHGSLLRKSYVEGSDKGYSEGYSEGYEKAYAEAWSLSQEHWRTTLVEYDYAEYNKKTGEWQLINNQNSKYRLTATLKEK